MRTLLLALFSCSMLFSNAQLIDIDFENGLTTEDFVDFDGGTASVIPNPQMMGSNMSATVAQIVREGGQIWAGSKVTLAENFDFSVLNIVSMKVFTTAPVGTTVKFKLEGSGDTERDAYTTVSGQWETLQWDFTGEPMNFNTLVFMFDFGNIGNGSETSTFLFDDISQSFGGTQIDLPVDFESTTINYTVTDFGGNASTLVVDPTDPLNHVIQSIKTSEAATWAGTTIGTNAGFASDIPITLEDSKMTIRVWSPTANTPIRLKVEDSNDPTHTCETETNTTLAGEWEIMEFDFTNEAPGTQPLSVGLGMGWTFNMASIFFNFGTDGANAGEQTYYFDDVMFGEFVISTSDIEIADLKVFPNPTTDFWTITSASSGIRSVMIYDATGRIVYQNSVITTPLRIDARTLSPGSYVCRIETMQGVQAVQLRR